MGRRHGSRRGGFEPATLSLATLAAVTGISGYGASVMNKDQAAQVHDDSALQAKIAELTALVEKLRAEKPAAAPAAAPAAVPAELPAFFQANAPPEATPELPGAAPTAPEATPLVTPEAAPTIDEEFSSLYDEDMLRTRPEVADTIADRVDARLGLAPVHLLTPPAPAPVPLLTPPAPAPVPLLTPPAPAPVPLLTPPAPAALPPVSEAPPPSRITPDRFADSIRNLSFSDDEPPRSQYTSQVTRRRGGMRKKKLRTRRGVKQNVR